MKIRIIIASLSFVALSISLNSVAVEPQADENIIIITGTRMIGRLAADSPAPVDVISEDEFANQAGGDMADLIRKVIPSYSVNATGDAGSLVRPANLRGLPSDAILIMVNGKRRHRSAVISFIGAGLSDGAQGPDVSVIPYSAIKQLEVLRDGASAQYGSDAIAGVMNFVLKDVAEGGFLEAKLSETYEGDGNAYQLAGNRGFDFTKDGFVNLSFEYHEADPTSRSVQSTDAANLIAGGNTAVSDPAQPWGSQEVFNDFKSFFNMGIDLSGTRNWYAFGNYAERRVETGFSFRNPNMRGGVFGSALNLAGAANDANGNSIPFMVDANNNTISREQIVDINGVIRSDIADQAWTRRYDRLVLDVTSDGLSGDCPITDLNNNGGLDIRDSAGLLAVETNPNCFVFTEYFPGGFTPRFGAKLKDSSIVTGLSGSSGQNVHWDISGGAGRNEAEFYIRNTVNASMGPDSPTEFIPGTYVQTEKNINADIVYSINGDIAQNIAAGFEWHEEQFQVIAGDMASWQPGPYFNQGFSIGSNGFSGFSPDVVGKWRRSNIAFYGDYEVEVNSDLLFGAAVRWEDFDSFGTTTNYKLSGYWSLTDNLALRSTLSTGFRAPTPGQDNISNITTVLSSGELINRGTIPPINGIAQLYGGEALMPEESLNYTLGAIIKYGDLKLTIDTYQVDMTDRITQSADIEISAAEAQQLEDSGFSGASGLRSFRFYINDFDTTTKGIDLIAIYPFELMGGTSLLNLTYNYNTTEITKFNAVTLDEVRIKQIEDSIPNHRGKLTWNHQTGSWRTLMRLNYFGKYWIAHANNPDWALEPSAELTLDAELAYNFGRNNQYAVVAGAENLFNNAPDKNPFASIIGAKYPENAPMGDMGGIYYLRLHYQF